MLRLGELARDEGDSNIAFLCAMYSGDPLGAVELLCDEGSFAEAALLARTYVPGSHFKNNGLIFPVFL